MNSWECLGKANPALKPALFGKLVSQSETSEDLQPNSSLTHQKRSYQISRPRERWTDVERAKFQEALRIYGRRQWKKIEEHIDLGELSLPDSGVLLNHLDEPIVSASGSEKSSMLIASSGPATAMQPPPPSSLGTVSRPDQVNPGPGVPLSNRDTQPLQLPAPPRALQQVSKCPDAPGRGQQPLINSLDQKPTLPSTPAGILELPGSNGTDHQNPKPSSAGGATNAIPVAAVGTGAVQTTTFDLESGSRQAQQGRQLYAPSETQNGRSGSGSGVGDNAGSGGNGGSASGEAAELDTQHGSGGSGNNLHLIGEQLTRGQQQPIGLASASNLDNANFARDPSLPMAAEGDPSDPHTNNGSGGGSGEGASGGSNDHPLLQQLQKSTGASSADRRPRTLALAAQVQARQAADQHTSNLAWLPLQQLGLASAAELQKASLQGSAGQTQPSSPELSLPTPHEQAGVQVNTPPDAAQAVGSLNDGQALPSKAGAVAVAERVVAVAVAERAVAVDERAVAVDERAALSSAFNHQLQAALGSQYSGAMRQAIESLQGFAATSLVQDSGNFAATNVVQDSGNFVATSLVQDSGNFAATNLVQDSENFAGLAALRNEDRGKGRGPAKIPSLNPIQVLKSETSLTQSKVSVFSTPALVTALLAAPLHPVVVNNSTVQQRISTNVLPSALQQAAGQEAQQLQGFLATSTPPPFQATADSAGKPSSSWLTPVLPDIESIHSAMLEAMFSHSFTAQQSKQLNQVADALQLASSLAGPLAASLQAPVVMSARYDASLGAGLLQPPVAHKSYERQPSLIQAEVVGAKPAGNQESAGVADKAAAVPIQDTHDTRQEQYAKVKLEAVQQPADACKSEMRNPSLQEEVGLRAGLTNEGGPQAWKPSARKLTSHEGSGSYLYCSDMKSQSGSGLRAVGHGGVKVPSQGDKMPLSWSDMKSQSGSGLRAVGHDGVKAASQGDKTPLYRYDYIGLEFPWSIKQRQHQHQVAGGAMLEPNHPQLQALGADEPDTEMEDARGVDSSGRNLRSSSLNLVPSHSLLPVLKRCYQAAGQGHLPATMHPAAVPDYAFPNTDGDGEAADPAQQQQQKRLRKLQHKHSRRKIMLSPAGSGASSSGAQAGGGDRSAGEEVATCPKGGVFRYGQGGDAREFDTANSNGEPSGPVPFPRPAPPQASSQGMDPPSSRCNKPQLRLKKAMAAAKAAGASKSNGNGGGSNDEPGCLRGGTSNESGSVEGSVQGSNEPGPDVPMPPNPLQKTQAVLLELQPDIPVANPPSAQWQGQMEAKPHMRPSPASAVTLPGPPLLTPQAELVPASSSGSPLPGRYAGLPRVAAHSFSLTEDGPGMMMIDERDGNNVVNGGGPRVLSSRQVASCPQRMALA
eukprot:gene23810-9373_t